MKNTLLSAAIAGAIGGALMTTIILENKGVQTTQLLPETQNNQSIVTNDYESAIISATQKAQPAVVSIVISKDVPIIERYFDNQTNPFGGFFNFQVPRLRQNGTEKQEVGGGSGFLVSEDGLIITNRHVVDLEDAEYAVFLNDGTKYDAEVIARDPVLDVAVLKISGSDFPYLLFTDSDELQVGQTVIAIGNALAEFQNSVSTGVVSGLSRSIQAGDRTGASEQLDEVIQTDAAINPGNSGGPLLNISGNVVGVNVAVALNSQNVGFALPSNGVKAIVESVQETGKISRPYVGVRYIPVTPALQETNNLSVDYGMLIARGETPQQLAVAPGSPANKAGIVEGDIILEIDGEKLDGDTSLATVVRKKKVGDTISVKLLSAGNEKTVSVTLEEFPE